VSQLPNKQTNKRTLKAVKILITFCLQMQKPNNNNGNVNGQQFRGNVEHKTRWKWENSQLIATFIDRKHHLESGCDAGNCRTQQ